MGDLGVAAALEMSFHNWRLGLPRDVESMQKDVDYKIHSPLCVCIVHTYHPLGTLLTLIILGSLQGYRRQ